MLFYFYCFFFNVAVHNIWRIADGYCAISFNVSCNEIAESSTRKQRDKRRRRLNVTLPVESQKTAAEGVERRQQLLDCASGELDPFFFFFFFATFKLSLIHI